MVEVFQVLFRPIRRLEVTTPILRREKLNKLKINDCSSSLREMTSQVKPLFPNLKKSSSKYRELQLNQRSGTEVKICAGGSKA